MSLISDALKRVAEQRAGRKQPPVVPRILAGQGPQHKRRLLMLLGLTMLLAGVVIGVVVYGVIQRKAAQNEAEEAPTTVPQQVIFEKISPPPETLKSAADAEPQPEQDAKEDQRIPVKPKVVQVAIPQEPSFPEKEVKSPSSPVEKEEAEQPVTTAAIEPDDSSLETEGQPLQPSNKVKVGLVSLRSAEQVEGHKESVRTEKARKSTIPPVDKDKPEQLAALDSTKRPEPVVITGGQQRRPVGTKKTGQVNLYTETTPGAASLYRRAVACQKAWKWEEAIEAYKGVLKYEPMSAEVYNNIGVCYEKQDKLKMAAKSYEKAISINPRFYPSYNNLGIIYYKMKDFNKARAAYEQALQLNPGNSQSEINLALVYERLRRGELARRTLERVLTNDPENAEAHYNLGRMLEDQGQHQRALGHYRQFLASNPSAYPQLLEKVKDRVRTLEGTSNK